jgi:hypothetical protein
LIPLTLISLALVALLAFRELLAYRERQEWAKERRLLVTRIQSPELAPMLAPRPDDEDEPAEPVPGRRTELEEIRALVDGDGS